MGPDCLVRKPRVGDRVMLVAPTHSSNGAKGYLKSILISDNNGEGAWMFGEWDNPNIPDGGWFPSQIIKIKE